MKRVTYLERTTRLVEELNLRLVAQGANTFVSLARQLGSPEVDHSPLDVYYLTFRRPDGSVAHTTSVIGNTPREAFLYVRGYLDATCAHEFAKVAPQW